LAFGLFAYLWFVGTFVYSVGFLGDFGVSRTIDSGPHTTPPVPALAINCVLLSVFAVQHSWMARTSFKNFMRRYIPESLERSVYVAAASGAMHLLFWEWRPIPWELWRIASPSGQAALWVVYTIGWGIVLACCFIMSHAHLFGMGQVWAYWRGRPYVEPTFRMNFAYRFVRNPQMLGFLITFWAAPTMTFGRFFLAAISTIYVLVALQLEKRDLLKRIGAPYAAYCTQTALLISRLSRRRGDSPAAAAEAQAREVCTGGARHEPQPEPQREPEPRPETSGFAG
jgi:protein-S-isoprenylcysteine O-methyltransferase Ste14